MWLNKIRNYRFVYKRYVRRDKEREGDRERIEFLVFIFNIIGLIVSVFNVLGS